MTLAGKTAQCAQNVMDSVKNGGSNWLYNTNYFGKAMRGHIAEMQRMGEVLPSQHMRIVGRAEVCLKAYCDGKDCSFVMN